MWDISLAGEEELIKQFEKIAVAPDGLVIKRRLFKIAQVLRNKIRQKAPRGKYEHGKLGRFRLSGVSDSSLQGSFQKAGNLRKSIEARYFRKNLTGYPAVYVRVNRKKAPHYHLVEFGTNNFRYPKKSKVLRFDLNGEEVFAKYVAPMPPQPFFRNTVDAAKGEIGYKIKEATEEVIINASLEK